MTKKKKSVVYRDSTLDDLIGQGIQHQQPTIDQPEPDEAPRDRSLLRTAGDYGISALKGAIGVPEAVVGLADIPTGGRVGQALESIGFRPKDAKAYLNDQYSDQQKQAFQNVGQAEGFGGKFVAALQNPSVITHGVVESLPSMGAGAVVGRGIMAAAPRVSGALAAGVGEGVIGGGSAAEQIRQETPDGLLTPAQAGLAVASGLGTTAFGVLGNKVAKSLGIHDVDTMLVSAATNPAAAKGVVRRVLEGAASEGILEELPQSIQERVLQNVALGKDLTDGVDQAAVLGLLSGAAMGGGANILGGGHQATPATAADPMPPAAAAPLALPAPVITVGPDGTAQTVADRQSARDAGPLARAASLAANVTDVVAKPGALARAAITQVAPAPVAINTGAIDAGQNDQAPSDAGNVGIPGAGGAELSPVGEPAPAAGGAGPVAGGLPGSEAAITADDIAQHVAAQGAPEVAAAPQTFATYDEADAYRREQKQRGTSVQALPVPTDGGFTLAVKGSPEYPAAEKLREERRAAKERADAGILDGDILNKLGKPFTIRLPAANAVKANPGFEVVAVQGGFVARKAAAPTNQAKETPADVPQPAKTPEETSPAPGAQAAPEKPAAVAPAIAGAPINKEWTAFSPESGTKSIPRADMPQIKAEHRGAMVNFLNARGIAHEQVEIPAGDLKPTQAEFSPAKVELAKAFEGGDRSILVSADGHVLDGHHQWLAKMDAGEPVKAIRLDAPIGKLLEQVKEFPSAEAATGAPPVAEPAIVEHTTGKGKLLRGTVRTDLSKEDATALDPYTFKKNGGWFIRENVGKQPAAQAEPAQAATETIAEKKPTPKPTANTIFTEDAAAAARARLKSKLGRLNSGIDPETLMDGITLAGYHIERGARSFAAYAKAMVSDLGEGVKPFLKSWYMGVKFDPRATAFDGMDSAASVEAADLDAAPQDAASLSDALYEAIQANGMPKDNPALRNLVEQFDGQSADNARLKQAQEELEAAIARTARDVVAKKEGVRSTFDILMRLYESQPNLNIRTSTSIANQAYSTPAPLAYLSSELVGITSKDKVLEPTGGTGMLLMAANPANTLANELNDHRAELLRAQGFEVTQNDAATGSLGKEKSRDVVVTNPPFGSIKDSAGNPTKVAVDGYRLGQIDHLIAARALATLKDDGRATLILGANKVQGGISNDDLIFFNWLYGHYNVTGHFEVAGDLYGRQGANWPVRVVSIQGRQASSATSPVAGSIKRADNWNQVYEHFTQSLATSRAESQPGATQRPVGERASEALPGRVPEPSGGQVANPGQRGAERGAGSAGDVAGERTQPVADRGEPAAKPVGAGDSQQRPDGNAGAGDQLEPARVGDGGRPGDKPARAAGATALASEENQFQAGYVSRSSRKDEGVLIPVNMAGPTQDALSKLEDAVGDIDQFAAKELGYPSTKALHNALMGLQVDSVASAIYQIKQGKGVVIADQTGIGKGRQAAAVIRWATKNGHTPVFVTVKPSLFTDMYGDLADIGTSDVQPFIMNGGEWISGAGGEKLFANKALGHKRTLEGIAETGRLPDGANALFMTYSQINVDNAQRRALAALAPKAVFVLDESHNAGGASATGEFITQVLESAVGVTYLSATYAKRPDNMPLYFKTDIGQASADNDGLMAAMAAGGLPLQTVVSNNLVKAGQMFRRERSYDGVSIESVVDAGNRAVHEKLSDATTQALRAIVSADKMFHEVYVKQLAADMAQRGARVLDNAGNQAEASVQHTEFSSVVHNFVRQMLLGLKAQAAADHAISALKRGEKPIIAVENTMGSFLNEYAAANGVQQGGDLGAFDYRTVLSRALARTLAMTEQLPTGEKVKREVPLTSLDTMTREAYRRAQDVIDSLDADIPVSPIDWMRSQIQKAGFSVAEITGRNLSVDYSNPAKPVLSAIEALEQKDKVRTTRLFNSGKLDALVLNVAGSTGISLHASEKFEDQRVRHMIVAQPAQDINIFMQMLGRIHRTGQVALPKYTILSVDLPTEKRPTALLSKKMKSLNANTSSNTESATSVKTADMLNKYGDQVVGQYLADNFQLTQALGLDAMSEGSEPVEDIARKATGRLALQPIKTQNAFYEEIEGQYHALIDYLNKTNQNDLEPRTFDYDARETRQDVIFEGADPKTPFGEDAIYGEYSIKAQGTAMTPAEIKALMAEHLAGKTAQDHVSALLAPLTAQFTEYAKTLPEGAQQESAMSARSRGQAFIQSHPIGSTFRVDINGDTFNAVVTNLRSTHKTYGNPFSLSKIQVSLAVNGALRNVTVPATQFAKIEVSSIGRGYSVDQLFKEQPANQRETAKIVTGNLLGAYGEIQGARGTIITFTKQDGTTDQGILLPKAFDFSKNTRGDYRLATGAEALKFLQKSENKDIGRFGIQSRDGVVRVLPERLGVSIAVPKSKLKGGKYFLDAGLVAITGDFVTVGSSMKAYVDSPGDATKALDLLMKKQALYALPSMSEEARAITESDKPAFSRGYAVNGLPVAEVQREVDDLTRKWANAPKVVVASNIDDPRVPEAVRAERDKRQSLGAAGAPRGVFLNGTVYLLADQLPTPAHAAITLFHESLGHAGLRGTFGDALNPILRQIADLRRADVAEKAQEYNLDLSKPQDRLIAAEEVLAEWAQRRPDLGYVKRAIAAVRNWFRNHIPGFKNMVMTDDEIVANYLIPARGWVERGGADRSSVEKSQEPMFSRADAGVNNPGDFRTQSTQAVRDMFQAPGTVNWWHKTVGTMHNLAKRSPQFGRVFNAVQDFLGDVSAYATEAADLAPTLLPKLETWRDIGKSPISAADTKAIAAPIFEGTLSWARNEDGSAVRVQPGADGDKAGIVFTDAELKTLFKLTPEQIKLYREFRASTDQSLNRLGITEMLRFGGKDVEAMRGMALDAGTAQDAAGLLEEHLLALAKENPDRAEVLQASAQTIVEKADKIQGLIDQGYAPLSRFGHFTVDVLDEKGERAYFGMFESKAEANRMARQMRENYLQGTIAQGTVSEQAYKMFSGITPETLELFGEMVGLESTGDTAQDQMFQEYLKLAKANRSAMKRLIHRKGIAGFSEDAGRVLAGFVYSNARLSSTNLHTSNINQSTAAIPKGEGEVKDMAIKLADYVRNPQEEAQQLRGLMFAQYLGGSVASAMVNMTQPVTVTMPYLSQWGGAMKATGRMRGALADVLKKSTGDAKLDAALKKAADEGIVAPQEVHQLMAQAAGRGALQAGDGTFAGDLRAKAGNALSKVSLAWGKPFAAAEQFNRRVTFIAAWRTAIAEGIANPAKFAEEAIRETQFVYNKGNKPQWARGAIGGTLFTFKQYSISYMELMHRMYTQGGPEGKRAVLLAMAMLFLVGGSSGLPFVGDAEDVVDGVMQSLGYSFSSKQARRQFFIDTLGEGAATFVERGISGLPGVPIDVAGRLGMGNLIPGTGLLTKKADHGRDVAELLGPAGDLAQRAFQGAGQIITGDPLNGLGTMSPAAIRNLQKSLDMYQTGMYRDQKGRKVIDVDGYDALVKAIGFQPTAVARVQDAVATQQNMIAQNKMMKTELADNMATAMYEQDADAQQSVRDRMRRWNASNPSSPVSIDMLGVRRRLMAMRASKAERIAKSAPKAIRVDVQRSLAEGSV
nr:PLxRFG domain-containing protein [uncultured Albidiferax sp.]